MHNAYAAADLVLCRSGAMTCAEVAAVGLPAVFVPLPIGNGEQSVNALPLVTAGAALVVNDADLTTRYVTSTVLPLVRDTRRLEEMSAAAADLGHRDADERLASIILEVAR
jgi:UDP-N-acetylglucosamine--N-acetylmuramyl-(pentapeptide) pyrophosphoryl-undecaprenol N-acetylglucosamine transferase